MQGVLSILHVIVSIFKLLHQMRPVNKWNVSNISWIEFTETILFIFIAYFSIHK